MVGGAPVTQQFAEEIGADGYSDNASSAVALARRLRGGGDGMSRSGAVARPRARSSPTERGARSCRRSACRSARCRMSGIWSTPEQVEAVAGAYVDAGSQVILTNTFRANGITLAEAGLARRLEEINRAGVEISKRGAAGRALGVRLDRADRQDADGGRVHAEAGDARRSRSRRRRWRRRAPTRLLIETMSDIAEAKLALAAAKPTGLPVIVSFAFDTGKNKDRTMMGGTPEKVAREMEAAGADAVGANCGAGVESFVAVCRRLQAACSLPVWIKANAGLPELKDGAVTYARRPSISPRTTSRCIEAGASFVGGCCGTSPDFIRASARPGAILCA